MPVATISPFTKLTDVVGYWKQQLTDNKDKLGISSVKTYDQTIMMNDDYPAIIIIPNPEMKDVHAMHTWLYTWRIFIYVLHSDISQDHMTRSETDVLLAEAISEFMETDLVLGGRVIFSYVEAKAPGAVPASLIGRDSGAVCTRLTWFATSEGRF